MNSEEKITLDLLLEQVEHLRTSVLNSTRKLRELSRQPYYKKNFDHLFSIPGIGTITAMTILTEVVDAKRFPNERTQEAIAVKEGFLGKEKRQSPIFEAFFLLITKSEGIMIIRVTKAISCNDTIWAKLDDDTTEWDDL